MIFIHQVVQLLVKMCWDVVVSASYGQRFEGNSVVGAGWKGRF
jgi:hypothetical protein